MTTRTLSLLALFCSVSLATEIEILEKESGNVVATLNSEVSSSFRIEDKEYTAKPRMPICEKRAREIILPNVSMKDFGIVSCVDYLNSRSKEFSPEGRPLNIVVVDSDLESETVNLKLEEVSFYTVLKTVAEYTKCSLVFEDERIVLRESKVEPGRVAN